MNKIVNLLGKIPNEIIYYTILIQAGIATAGITGNNYDKIVQELKKKDQDILEQLKDHSRGDEAFLITASYILELAHRAYTLFRSSQTAQKRELINFVFANFEADGGNLLYKIKEPFGELLFCAKSSKWLPG